MGCGSDIWSFVCYGFGIIVCIICFFSTVEAVGAYDRGTRPSAGVYSLVLIILTYCGCSICIPRKFYGSNSPIVIGRLRGHCVYHPDTIFPLFELPVYGLAFGCLVQIVRIATCDIHHGLAGLSALLLLFFFFSSNACAFRCALRNMSAEDRDMLFYGISLASQSRV